MDRRGWWAMDYGVTKSWTLLSNLQTPTHMVSSKIYFSHA